MTIPEKYTIVIDQINAHIQAFNAFLAPEHKLIGISVDDPSMFANIAQRKATGNLWPSKDSVGVYILCGHHENDATRLGIYIGKASVGDKRIGHRLWSHLVRFRVGDNYRMIGRSKEPYILEALLAIPIAPATSPSIAAALEEHLIAQGLVGISIINTVGKKNSKKSLLPAATSPKIEAHSLPAASIT